MNEHQERYWQELYDLKVHVTYLEVYLMGTEKIDKLINAFLAVASSASIAGWVIWKEYQFIWASIIVLSQFITAIKSFLPYSSRIKSISKILKEMELLSIEYEEKWFYIADGRKTEEEINTLRFELKKNKSKIMRKYFITSVLPDNKNYLQEAERLTQDSLNNYYN
ncbi:MAG: hypothetical protein P8Y49_05730 [Sulfurovaceae bacterium]